MRYYIQIYVIAHGCIVYYTDKQYNIQNFSKQAGVMRTELDLVKNMDGCWRLLR